MGRPLGLGLQWLDGHHRGCSLGGNAPVRHGTAEEVDGSVRAGKSLREPAGEGDAGGKPEDIIVKDAK